MFSRHRPIPSARTIKLLYQLGYIASGTAAGLATLCLEEQRRRIKVLQKVADNAKIIRQHPRHRGDLAIAVEAEDEFKPPLEWPRTEEVPQIRRRRQRRRTSEDASERGGQGSGRSISPAETEGGVWKSAPAGGIVVHDTLLPHEQQLSTQFPSVDSSLARSPEKMSSRLESADLTRNSIRNTRSSTRRPPKFSSELDLGARMPLNPLRQGDFHSERVFRPTRASSGEDRSPKSGRSERAAPNSEDPVDPILRNLSNAHSRMNVNTFDMPLDSLAQRMDSFTGALSSGAYRSPSARDSISSHLLQTALANGSVEEIQSTCRWKLFNGTFSKSDATAICSSCGDLGRKQDHDKLYDLFATLFESEAFSKLDTTFRLEQTMAVAQQMLGWRPSLQPKELRRKVFWSGLQYVNDDQVQDQLEKCCRDLMAKNEISIAAALVHIFADPSRRTPRIVTSIDKSLNDAMEQGRLKECMIFLRWKAACLGNESIRMQLKPFIHACGYTNAHSLLIEFFNSQTGLGLTATLLSNHLGVDSKVILAKAFGNDELHGDGFQRLSKSLPKSLRPSVESLREIPALSEMWKTTRNLEHIDARASELRTQLNGQQDETPLRQLEEALLEIYIEAGEVDRAITMVYNTHGMHNVTLCQTALALAKISDWRGMDRLLEIMKNSESFRFDRGAARIFNDVISKYSRHHDTKQTWDFVDAAMRDLGFIPSQETTEVMLLSFIRADSIEFIPQWIDFMQQKGQQHWINAQTAAVLLERYCVQYRPSHILLMWLCRKLITLSPSLAGEPLLHVVKQTIGWDLRHLYGQYDTWQQGQAQERLNRVQEAKDLVPSPGFVWNDRLYFHESEENDDTTQETGKHDVDWDDSKDVKRNMWLNMSLGRYETVLDLYQSALDPRGLPPSPDILDAAVDSSLHLHNGIPTHAEKLIAQARKAGMNTSCADVPLFIHRVQRWPPKTLHDVQKLRRFVLDHYRKNEKNRWPVSHHLATTAAHSLIIRGFAEQGVDLLRSLHESHWAEKHPFNHVNMAVMLKGYIALQSLEGMQWVVQTVLDQDIRITKPFMKHLKSGRKFILTKKHIVDNEEQFESWIEQCNERRLQQMAKTRKIGWSLIKALAKSTKEGPSRDVDAINTLEEYSIEGDGTAALDKAKVDFKDESYFSDEVEHDDSIRDERHSDFKKRMDEDWKAEQEFRLQMKAIRRAHQDQVALKKQESIDTLEKVKGRQDQEASVEQESGDSMNRAKDDREDEQEALQTGTLGDGSAQFVPFG